MAQVIGNRIILEKYQEKDRAHFLSVVTDQEVMKFVDGTHSLEAANRLFDRFLNPTESSLREVWAIRSEFDGQYLGHAALFESKIVEDFEREILFYLLQPFWGKGYATEAAKLMIRYGFEQAHYQSIGATLNTDHLASKSVCENAGLKFHRHGRDEQGSFLIYKLGVQDF